MSNEAVLPRLCRCKAKRTGKPCKAPAMPNGCCRMHGGASPGAPLGNQNARKHGFYSKNLTKEEIAQLEEVKRYNGTVDNELVMLRFQLARAFDAKALQDAAVAAGDYRGGLVLDEMLEREGHGIPLADRETKFKRIDWDAIIFRLSGRIGDLEKTRKLLMADEQGDWPIDGIEIVEYEEEDVVLLGDQSAAQAAE